MWTGTAKLIELMKYLYLNSLGTRLWKKKQNKTLAWLSRDIQICYMEFNDHQNLPFLAKMGEMKLQRT